MKVEFMGFSREELLRRAELFRCFSEDPERSLKERLVDRNTSYEYAKAAQEWKEGLVSKC